MKFKINFKVFGNTQKEMDLEYIILKMEANI